MGKRFIFRNYGWIAIAGVAIAMVVVHQRKAQDRTGLIGPTIGAALGFCYFVQKQKLDELRLFSELFASFNQRYGGMNKKLEDIRAGSQLSDSDLKNALVDYFNLCAEEYLFYEEGFIHRAAWRSWCLGMKYYLDDKRIRKIWDDEVGRDSYYGLTLDVICKGGSLPRKCFKVQELSAN